MKSVKERHWWRWITVPILAISVLVLIGVFFSFFGVTRNSTVGTIGMGFFLAIFLFEGVRFINRQIDRRVTWQRNPAKRFIIQFLLDLGFILFLSVVVKLGILIYVLHMDLKIVKKEEIIVNIIIVFIAFIFVLADMGIFLVRRWAYSIAELEKSEKENLQFRYEILISQINPHFLFNSLNTLASLIYSDQEKAAHFTRQLSKYFRNVLEVRGTDMITLKEELQLADAYFSLLKIRFHEGLVIRFDAEKLNLDAWLPSMTIQLLIENAVNHNIISAKQVLTVDIYKDQGFLVVRNNLQEKDLKTMSTGIGLKNISERYWLIGNRKIEIEKTTEFFLVKLPLIEAL
jgi:two-component system LytT family sensor kinase